MARGAHEREPGAPERPASPRPAGAGGGRTVAARALALQQQRGNRAAARILARWTKHPDPEQKGVMTLDAVAAELERLNPPQNT